MRKKGISIVVLVAAMSMTTLSFTGCGKQAEATNQEIENGETIVATSIESTSESTAENNNTTSTEVIGGTEVTEEKVFAGAENEDIVLNAEKSIAQYVGQENATFESIDVTFTAKEEIPLFNGNGEEVGYVKAGGSVTVTESVVDNNWARFVNPIEGTDYEYLYINKKVFPDENAIYVTAEDIESMLVNQVNNRAYELPTVLDAPTDDMEVHEFVIAKEYKSQLEVEDAVIRGYSNDYSGGAMGYMTYYIECEEEENVIRCKIYYKDKYVKTSPF